MPFQPKPEIEDHVSKRAFFLEFLGTFSIVYVGGWTVWSIELGYVTLLGAAIQATFTIAFAVWYAATLTGAHFNGAVTMGYLCSRHITFKKFLIYHVAEFLGSFIAGFM